MVEQPKNPLSLLTGERFPERIIMREAARANRQAKRRRAEFARLVADGRKIARADAAEVARLEQRQNPNRGKRHAAKLDNSPRLTPRQYAPGAPDSQRHYMPTLETSFARIPSLGSTLTKRPLKK